MSVYLDAGHPSIKGDVGAKYVAEDGTVVTEMDLNWSVVEGLEKVLGAAGVSVVRSGAAKGEVMSLGRRSAKASLLGAGLAISIHHNASEDPSYHGLRVFYNNSVAHEVAQVILDNAPLGLEKVGRKPNHMDEKGWSRVARVLENYKMPAVLVEVGYMSSARDRRVMFDPDSRAAVLAAVLAGVARFIQLGSDYA